MNRIYESFFGFIGITLALVISGIVTGAPIYAAIYDAQHNYIISAILDIIMPPYGIGRGIYLLLNF
ncbi:hypothetical protein [Commensalibacter oyaizuii]|uniref:Uncharacterized protein n=1 Tax=Commensalibacter oyaizuii TaxID=3043873 RepID=A0ABT6Q390_9PROT|nr:hypothetical protein [Commensalibacter sp. TBRC 16381]MDI2091577.1 hypothetical protein [Commensalibacter sp. TBRC 16381]